MSFYIDCKHECYLTEDEYTTLDDIAEHTSLVLMHDDSRSRTATLAAEPARYLTATKIW